MYRETDNRDIEDICFEQDHIDKVLTVIKKNFEQYFNRFLSSSGGRDISLDNVQELQKKFGIEIHQKKKNNDSAEKFKTIISESIENFEQDREAYKAIFNQELLEELDEDADMFKSKILRNECPIIHKTLANTRAKELDDYRYKFSNADADWLLEVVYKLCVFGDDYQKNYNPSTYENIQTYQDLNLELLDTEDYTVYGVIGGGIKTHMLYKVHPAIFPSRSQSAIWALWYLTDKKTFGCRTDSEFLMIDVSKSTTQQNYFYPYRLFAFYAFEIYKMLRDKATELKVGIDTTYRYVIVDAFLEFIASEHESEISLLKSQIKKRDGGNA